VLSRKKLRNLLAGPVESIGLQIPRALVVSVLAMLLDFGLLIALVEGLNTPKLVAATISYLAGGIIQYTLCSVWVFPNAPQNVAVGFTAFTLLSLVGLGITWVTMFALHEQMHLSYILAKIVALGLAFNWNFFSRKYLLFKPDPEPCSAAD
jgi:putative flippase GtrA